MGNGKSVSVPNGLGSGVDGGVGNGYRQSGVQSEAVREKGDWDDLFFQCTKKTLQAGEVWEEHGKAHPRHRRTVSLD